MKKMDSRSMTMATKPRLLQLLQEFFNSWMARSKNLKSLL
jgi:hypothetical protein